MQWAAATQIAGQRDLGGNRYHQQYGPWRRVVGEVMRKYLECGDLHRGIAALPAGAAFTRRSLPIPVNADFSVPHANRSVLLFAEWLE
jgi:hypothetical protein